MTLAQAKTMKHVNYETIEVVLEWGSEKVQMRMNGGIKETVYCDNTHLALPDASVDRVIIHKNRSFERFPQDVLVEGKRVLKRNGRMIVSLYHDEKAGLFSRISARIKGKVTPFANTLNITLDQLTLMISELNMLVDKNYVVEEGIVYFEIIKYENDKLQKMLLT